MPPHLVQQVCQLLMDKRFRYSWITTGFEDVMNLRATCRHINNVVKESRLKFRIRVILHLQRARYNLEEVDKLLKLLDKEFNWSCTSLTLDYDNRRLEDIMGAILMVEGPIGRKKSWVRTDNKYRRKSIIIKMNKLPLNYNELSEATFCFFYNETLEI